eukprot:jgi/Mesvir1/8356/Mv26526-RA.1
MVSKAFQAAVHDAIAAEGGMGPYLKAREETLPKAARASVNEHGKWVVPPSLGALRYTVRQKCTLCKRPFAGGFADSWGVYAHRRCLRERLVQVPSLSQYASAEEIVAALPAARHLGRPDASMMVWKSPCPACLPTHKTFEGCPQYPQWAARKAADDAEKADKLRRKREGQLAVARRREQLSLKRRDMAQARSDKVDGWLRSMRVPAELGPLCRALVRPFLAPAVAVRLRERCAASKLECFQVMLRDAAEGDEERVMRAALDTPYEPGATWRARVEERVVCLQATPAPSLEDINRAVSLMLASRSTPGGGASSSGVAGGRGPWSSSSSSSDGEGWSDDEDEDDEGVDSDDD